MVSTTPSATAITTVCLGAMMSVPWWLRPPERAAPHVLS